MISNYGSNRNAALRRLLASVANETPVSRPTDRKRIVALAITAFALAGVTTGGAVSAAALNAAEAPSAPSSDELLTRGVSFPGLDVYQQQAQVSAAYAVTAEDTATIELGGKPPSARSLVVQIECLTDGFHILSVDGSQVATLDCTYADHFDVAGGPISVDTAASHSVSIASSVPGAFKVWAVWSSQTVREFNRN